MLNKINLIKSFFHGATIQHPNMYEVLHMNILVPPIKTQEYIVSVLDKFSTLATSIKDGLPKEIVLITKQYEYYREQLLDFKK
ncbi:Type I restriction enzyme specificity protein [Mycoplasmopsis edwardii]|uniref:Type I restriction enzyme specificity protein n=1 Tax=Mycoplasmopsis edwardii TaxID=53558 RepID=A0A3B0Q4H8_9BACT|nr:restriction endonuclease subunit S [Mycoplasmopsis edwardii]SYV97656.1 Type I restriction enzyme specificity protein [Mycoplasmopsis edwardii]